MERDIIASTPYFSTISLLYQCYGCDVWLTASFAVRAGLIFSSEGFRVIGIGLGLGLEW